MWYQTGTAEEVCLSVIQPEVVWYQTGSVSLTFFDTRTLDLPLYFCGSTVNLGFAVKSLVHCSLVILATRQLEVVSAAFRNIFSGL